MSKQYGEPQTVDVKDLRAAPEVWLAGRMSEKMPYLLAHADDGVIWGKWKENGELTLSSGVFSDQQTYPAVAVKLRAETLQEARVFGMEGELRLWRTSEGFEARLLTDAGVGLDALPDEKHLLWHQGKPVAVSGESGFALLQEGTRGQRHAPPVIPKGKHRPTLVVRHYIDCDEEGQAYIALSRLVGLEE